MKQVKKQMGTTAKEHTQKYEKQTTSEEIKSIDTYRKEGEGIEKSEKLKRLILKMEDAVEKLDIDYNIICIDYNQSLELVTDFFDLSLDLLDGIYIIEERGKPTPKTKIEKTFNDILFMREYLLLEKGTEKSKNVLRALSYKNNAILKKTKKEKNNFVASNREDAVIARSINKNDFLGYVKERYNGVLIKNLQIFDNNNVEILGNFVTLSTFSKIMEENKNLLKLKERAIFKGAYITGGGFDYKAFHNFEKESNPNIYIDVGQYSGLGFIKS